MCKYRCLSWQDVFVLVVPTPNVSRCCHQISWLVPELLRSSDATTINALGSVVLDLYQKVAGLRSMDAKVVGAAMPELQSHIFSLSSIKRISYAFQVLIDASPKLRELGCVKHALLFAMSSMKEGFSAIRSAGGFDGKRARRSGNRASTHDTYVLDLCGRIQTHIEVMSAIVGGDNESQQIAKVFDCRLRQYDACMILMLYWMSCLG